MMKMSEQKRVMRLQCTVQNYDWGRVGEQSEVGRLYSVQSNTRLEEKPYAELWMGTHESGPSCIVLEDAGGSTMLLKDWLIENPEALGDKVVQRWGKDLPFLFKVLSVAKALSIQAHPDKNLAKQLHQVQPQIYKDANHKPEMALALTEFEALCGFVTSQELREAVETVPELQSVLGESLAKDLMNLSRSQVNEELAKVSLRVAFTTIMTASKDDVADALSKLIFRLAKEEKVRTLTPKEQLVIRLAKQYPSDVGVLSSFFFNYIHLAPGEALYLDANEPHAYLFGECIECMATSDNVVRAGLTPKYRDTKTLCAMLTYKQEPPEVLCGVAVNAYTRLYSPPFDEFEVDSSIIPVGHTVLLPSIPGPSVVLILKGTGAMLQLCGSKNIVTSLHRGDIFFVPAGVQLNFTASKDMNSTEQKHHPLHIYRAGVNRRALLE